MFEKYRKIEGFTGIPLSRGQYSINCLGIIVDGHGKEVLKRKNHKGELIVKADLWDGPGEYLVSLIMVVVFKSLKLPYKYWEKVEPFHIDNDLDNIHPTNIGYRFKGVKLETAKYEGYYYIPMCTKYAINIKGSLINIADGTNKTWLISGPGDRGGLGGYYKSALYTDIGYKITIGRHRLLVLVFLGYPNNVDKLVTNHIDGIPGNDWLDNLELITKGENNLHASLSGLKTQNKAVLCKSIDTGDIKEFVSTHECAKYIGCYSGENIRYAITQGNQFPYKNHRFKYKGDGIEWAKEHSLLRGILAQDIVSREVLAFDNQMDLANFLSVKYDDVRRYTRRTSPEPLKGYAIKRIDSVMPWPVYTKDEIKDFLSRDEHVSNKPKVLTALDTLSGKITEFPSMHKLCQFLGTTARSRITKSLNKHGELEFNKYILRYKN